MGMKSQFILIPTVLGIIGCGPLLSTSNDPKLEAVFQDKIQKFSSCTEMDSVMQQGTQFFTGVTADSSASPELAAPNSDSQLYDNQSSGVEESDRVLVNDTNIFVLRNESLEILNRSNFKLKKTLPLEDSKDRTMHVTNSKVVLVGSKNQDTTQISILNSNTLAVEFKTDVVGYFKDVRIVKDQLIVMTAIYQYLLVEPNQFGDNGQVGGNTPLNSNPSGYKEAPSCQEVYYPQVNAFNSNLTYLYNFSLNSLQTPAAKTGFVGQSDVFYMTDSALYLLSNSYYQFPSYVRKVVWEKGTIELKAVGRYEGEVLNRWAVNEITESSGKKLALASTISPQMATQLNFDGNRTIALPTNNARINKITILSENNSILEKYAESDAFAPNETIRSVRYSNHLAYVVTFRTTDPLFVFDLQNTKSIKKLGELKVPGFSTHLRSLSSFDLLGIGYDTVETNNGGVLTKGVQVSLFDVSNSHTPARTQVFTIGERGSSSAAQHDAHALMYDQNSGLIAMPIIEWTGVNSSDPWASGQILNFSGAQVYRFQNRSLSQVGRITHEKWRKSYPCNQWMFFGWWSEVISPDVNRVVTIDNILVSISQFGLMTHNPQNLSVLSEQPFAQNKNGFCSEPLAF